MPAAGGVGQSFAYASSVLSFAGQSLVRLVRSPSHSRRVEAARKLAFHWLLIAAIGGVVVVVLMYGLDAREIGLMPPRGSADLWPLRILTDFGKSEYVLGLLAMVLAVFAAISPRFRGASRVILIATGTRIQFLFLAVAIPVLAGDLIKGIVGRGRPFVGGEANAFNFSHFAWTPAYASFPSGHAITSFALAFAVAALWPRTRIVMLIYALVIIATRLILLAHHPSDVVAGGILGVVGAMFVRYWFAARHLCFSIDGRGAVKPLVGPSAEQLKRVAREALAP
ncbi:MAG: phosphatase PAP2 family protein [Rhizobiales bacterium]|nr:phosphatase PAP2 family protein [Hyphomicrobiales bacterium]